MDLARQKTPDGKLWFYTILPPLILNLGSFCTYGAYYAMYYIQPERIEGIAPGMARAATDVLIFLVEWAFAISIFLRYRRAGQSTRPLFAPGGDFRCFRLRPALLLFASWNLLFAVYMLALTAIYPSAANIYQGLPMGIRLLQIMLIPATAAFCEELIWRAYIPTRMEQRGYQFWSIVLLSSLSFAAIHGIFLPDKLILTFLLGVIAVVYYLKERSLVPIILTHWVVDLWSFGLFIFG